MIETLVNIPVFGMVLTMACFWTGICIYNKFNQSFLQPILTATILIIIVLKITDVDYEIYKEQNAVLNFMLAPAAVVLAVPLYKNVHILKKNAIPLIMGVICGSLVTIGSCIIFGKLMGTKESIIITMIPKGVTNPIAIEVSRVIGGIPELTVVLVVFTGIIGGSFGPEIIRFLGIKNKVAKGIALGSMCHAIGTARAFKEGDVEGAMSSLAMGIAGIFTALAAPFIVDIFF